MKYKCTRDPQPQRLHTHVFEPARAKKAQNKVLSLARVPIEEGERERISNIGEETGWARVCAGRLAGCIIYQIKRGISVNASKSQRNGTLSLFVPSSNAVLPHNSHLAFIRAIYASLNCLKCYSRCLEMAAHMACHFSCLPLFRGFYQKEYGKSSLPAVNKYGNIRRLFPNNGTPLSVSALESIKRCVHWI